MELPFIKCHGSGNDFVLCDARGLVLAEEDWATIARLVSDRAGPIGSDGLLALADGDAHHGFAMRMWNSDGSESETCLNGLRCVARLGFERTGVAMADVRLFNSGAHVVRTEPLADGVYTVAETAGPADLAAARWVRAAGDRWVDTPIPGLPSARAFTAVAMPNPHLIAFVDRIDDAELSALGDFAEAAPPLLPERANVSFVEVRSGDTLYVRTRERGVGLTNSCGSAMAAATYAAALTGRIGFDETIIVRNRGGRVLARAGSDAMVTIQGNATWEWGGTIALDLAAGQAGVLSVTERFADEVAAWDRLAGA